jgi:hypothetical protein
MKQNSFLVLCVLLLAFILCSVHTTATAQPRTDVVGYVDSVGYDEASRQLKIDGWAWDPVTSDTAASLHVEVGGKSFELIPIHLARRDVQAALGIPLLTTGFSVTLSLNETRPSGTDPVQVTAFFADGRSFSLPASLPVAQHASPTVVGPYPTRHWALLGLVIAGIALAYVPWLRSRGQCMGDWVQAHPRRVTAAIAVAFALLTMVGVTGSSWQLLSDGAGGHSVEFQGSHAHVFEPRLIRLDEWGVLTPNALAQWNHAPRFPVVNTNLGVEGQNMGVIGMTGTPIAQPAALARPATWGYFFLPLRQAMAWHWQFPFFACLFFLWQALNLLRPSQSGFNLLLSLSFCVAPYAAGWSLWPLYAAFFPLALFVAAAALLRTDSLAKTMSLGTAMGLLLAGWVLVLYPPWQITVGTLMAFVAAGWVADHWRDLRFRKAQRLGFGCAVLVAAAILGSWWLDTANAIAALAATVYPGGRIAQGGDFPWFWALRGYTNPETLIHGSDLLGNESGASAYFLLPIPFLLLGAWLAARSSHNRWTLRACMVFLAWLAIFCFAGIPLWLAQATFWGRVITYRTDLVVGLACTTLLALMHGQWQPPRGWRSRPAVLLWLMGVCVALTSVWLVIMEFRAVLPGLAQPSSPLLWAMALAMGLGAWWLMRGRARAAAGMLLLLNLATTFDFNPLSLTPRAVRLTVASAALATDSSQPDRHRLRTLVVNTGSSTPMTLAAANVPVVNGVLYYPHRTFWNAIGLKAQDWPTVNRYQHLELALAHLPDGPAFEVSHRLDAVVVTIDPQRFDFASAGAQRIVAQKEPAKLLRSNPELVELGHDGDLFWFATGKRISPQRTSTSDMGSRLPLASR